MSRTAKKQIDPAATRKQIMKAALHLFAQRGYKGASIGAIAEAAKVRKSLVQYHFGTKEQLWMACLEEKAEPLLGAVDRLLTGESTNIPDLLAARFRLLRDNPEVRQIIAWASMSSAPVPDFLKRRREGILEALVGDGKQNRLARFLFVLAATDGWFLFRNLYRSVLGEEAITPEIEASLLQLIMQKGPEFDSPCAEETHDS